MNPSSSPIPSEGRSRLRLPHPLLRAVSTVLAVILAIPNAIWAESLLRLTLERVDSGHPGDGGALYSVNLESPSATVGYALETSPDMETWTLLSTGTAPAGHMLSLGLVHATNAAQFIRAKALTVVLGDGPPRWEGAIKSAVRPSPPGAVEIDWNPAVSDVAIAEYRLFVDGAAITNLPGGTLSHRFEVDLQKPTLIEIQAVDTNTAASAVEQLAYLPANGIAIVSDDGGRVYVVHWQLEGGLGPPSLIHTFPGRMSRGAALGDFDNDGVLDLVTGYAANDLLFPFFFRGRGDGFFEDPIPLPPGTNSNNHYMDSAAGDWDCDGNLDVVVNCNTTAVFFYWGRGDGTFQLETRQLPRNGRAMDSGDFNEDGREDLVRMEYNSRDVPVFLSAGDRSFFQTNIAATLTVSMDPYGVAVGDFDGDGHLDLLGGQHGNGDIFALKGYGDGTFTNLTDLGLWQVLDVDNYSALDAFDYTGDGVLDMVVSSHGARAAYWVMGQGDFLFDTNRVTIMESPSGILGLASPPLPARVDIAIDPLRPVIQLGDSLTFHASGTGVNSNDVFRWSFGDATTNDTVWTLEESSPNLGPTVTHRFMREGWLATRLWHTDQQGRHSVRGTRVTVQAEPPIANPGGPYMFDEHSATQGVWVATLDGSASTDDYGIEHYLWSFGDGTSVTEGPLATHTWTNAGPWEVTLTVVDFAGLSHRAPPTTVTFVPGEPPVAVIQGPDVVDETSARNGTWTATFDALASADDFGVWKYEWNFGNNRTATGREVTANYTAAGEYTVSLLVTDHAGQTNLVTKQVLVKANDLPVPVIDGPRILSEAAATNGVWHGTWTASNSSDDQGIYDYRWAFGDGSTASGVDVSHGYAGAGTYEISLTVTDFGRQTSTTTHSVLTVGDQPPQARITADSNTVEGLGPLHLGAAASTDDHGIMRYRWFFAPWTFSFAGQTLDASRWLVRNAMQADGLLLTGDGSWGSAGAILCAPRISRGAVISGRVDTPDSGGLAMIGVLPAGSANASYQSMPHAIYFDNGRIHVYERGANQPSMPMNYVKGASYEFRIEVGPKQGASLYLREAEAEEPFLLLYQSASSTDADFLFGVDVRSREFVIDNLTVSGGFIDGVDIVTPVLAGELTLEVTDHALQSNRTSIQVESVVGAPPTSVINAPLLAPAGVELPFDAYRSSDDHGIRSYQWDFGDGSPIVYGPAVSHAFAQPGAYLVTLTVEDYAGQSASSEVLLHVTEGNAVVCVPWQIINGIELPHETYPGKEITLKAVARGVPLPFEYSWTFGDGSDPVSGTVTNVSDVYALEARHVYDGPVGHPYTATIRVWDESGSVYTDTYPVIIRPKTLDVEINVAIDEGLWYLHKNLSRYDIDAQNVGGSWSHGGYTVNTTASAVQAFAVSGHLLTDDGSQDPYVENVQRGINHLLTTLRTQPIGLQRFGDPDGNGNGIGLTVAGNRPIYETGPLMDALVAAGRPELVASVGGAWVKGRTYLDLMQDMVDMHAWGQTDQDFGGGWRYSWNSDSDNSACQWAAIGLMAAERFWGIPVPQWVKDRNVVWLEYSKGSTGFGYTGPGNRDATTPSGMVQIAFDDLPVTHPLWQHGEAFLANNWPALPKKNNLYANYAIAKALRTANPPVQTLALTGKNWFYDPDDGLARITIDRQREDGSWLSSSAGHVETPPISTAWSILILSQSIFQQGPVASAVARPNPSAVGYPIRIDATASYHRHPAYKVVDYRWDFDASDGVDFDQPDALGPVVEHAYGRLGTNQVSLQVRDNATPPLTDTIFINLRTTIPPYPPTADAGGPYLVAVGEDVTLNGAGSFDIDESSGDVIQAWDWELDLEVPYDFNDGLTGSRPVIPGGFSVAGVYSVGLRVTDSTASLFPDLNLENQTADDFTEVHVYNHVISDLVGRPKDNKCQLTWTKVGDYSAVLRSQKGPQEGFEEIATTASNLALYLDRTIEPNVEYWYRILAYQNGRTEPLGVSDAVYVKATPRSFDNRAPHFTARPPTFAYVNEPYEVTLEARDPENDPITFALLIGPANMTVHPASGTVSFLPTLDDVGSHDVSFEVSDAAGRDVLSYTLVVALRTNREPVLAIHGPYSGTAGVPVQMSSEGTYDPDEDELLLVWNFGDGTISFAPNPAHTYGAGGVYTVTLVANDQRGGTTTATTTATIASANRPPVANAGPDQRVLVGQTVTLDGVLSYDLDADTLSYQWEFALRPTNSQAVLLNPNTVRPTFVVDRPGAYAIRLVVSDGQATSQPDAVFVSTMNSAPVANAGPNQRVREGQTAQLDGTGSTDADDNPLTYRWTLLSRPAGSLAELSDAQSPTPTFEVDQFGGYVAELIVNDGQVDSLPDQVLVTTGNLPPEILSEPSTNAVPSHLWTYQVIAHDPEETALTYALDERPTGMSVYSEGLVSFTPTQAQLGDHPVVVRVTDAEGGSATQSFTLTVSEDTEGPRVTIELIAGQVATGTGQWAGDLGDTVAFQVTAVDNVDGEVQPTSLTLDGRALALDAAGTASTEVDRLGLFELVATAEDSSGNIGIATRTIWFRDPNASGQSDISIFILSPTNTAVVTRPTAIVATITNPTDLLTYRVDYAAAADLDLSDLAFEGPQFTTLTNVSLPPGTRAIEDTVLATFDPTILLNDDYLIRVVASDGTSIRYEGVVVSVTGELKFGEFRLEFTDLAVPVAGLPITVTRIYDTRDSRSQGDFGYGWSLGVRDAKIRKNLRNGTMFLGSRVYLNTPDGRRVGFTAGYQPSHWLFAYIGDVILQPDPGVYEKLEIVGSTVFYLGGSFYGGLGEQNYDPPTFRLTTRDGTVYTYHDQEGLQRIEDLHGNTLVLNRDGIFHFASGSTEFDQHVPFIRDSAGRITQIIDPAGNTLTYGYDTAGDLRLFTDQADNLTQYHYHPLRPHYLERIVDPLGRDAIRSEYDDAGRLVSITDALGNPVTQDFDFDQNIGTFTDANGHVTYSQYDDRGNEIAKWIEGIYTNRFEYDANNNLTNSIDGRGYQTIRQYDNRGNLTNIVDALTNSTLIAYNSLNRPLNITDALGHTRQFDYDSRGELTNVVNTLGGRASFTRDAEGRVTSVTDFNGHTTTYDYTGGCGCGEPSKVINPDGTFRLYDYNTFGQVKRDVNELGQETVYHHDGLGRLMWVQDAEGHTTRYTYEGALKTSETGPLGRTTWFAYDNLDRQIAITNAEGGVVRFEYDNGTNRTAVIDPVGNTTRFYYDANNRLDHQVDPWGRTNYFRYDPAGNRVEAIDRNGRRRTFAYDALNRRTNEVWWEGTNIVRTFVYEFNALGVMTNAMDPASTLSWEFDELNRLHKATQSGVPGQEDFILEYGYDGMTNVVSVTDNWGVQVVSEYGNRNLLKKRGWQGGELPGASLTFDDDAAGNRTNILRFADTNATILAGQSRYDFSPVGVITNILHAGPTGLVLAEYSYTLNAAQEITQRVLNGQTAEYGYDLTGQLTNTLYSAGQPNESFTYDANGNRIGGGYAVTTNNQIIADGTYTYGYDLEGSLVARTNVATGATTSYLYDHRNRLVQVVDYAADSTLTQSVSFTYDALNRRIAKTVNGALTRFLHNQDDIWADADEAGGLISRYLLGKRIDEMLVRYRRGEGIIWYLTDNLGSVHDLADSMGTVVNKVVYNCFGDVIVQSSSAAGDRFLFTGREYENEVGIILYRARFYMPFLGRFMSEDPLGFTPAEYNLVRYAQNAPLTRVDPTGTSWIDVNVLIRPSITFAQVQKNMLAAKKAAAARKALLILGIGKCTTSAIEALGSKEWSDFDDWWICVLVLYFSYGLVKK